MASFHIFFSISFLILFFLCRIATSQNFCQPSYCGDNSTVLPIKFPFQLNTTQTKGCGYPGFNLSCNTKSQTILTLPYSGDFIVREIDYFSQSLFITDPDHCLPERYLKNFTLLDSPFQFLSTGNNFTIYNCSSNVNLFGFGPIHCVKNSDNYSVWMSPSFYDDDMVPASCSVLLNSTMLPLLASSWVGLVWSEPNCEGCDGDCGCYNYNVQSRSSGSSSGTVTGRFN